MATKYDDASTAQSAPRQVRFLRQPEVLARVGVSWLTILRWEKQGHFPKRCKVGPRTVAWIEYQVDDFCARIAEQSGGGA